MCSAVCQIRCSLSLLTPAALTTDVNRLSSRSAVMLPSGIPETTSCTAAGGPVAYACKTSQLQCCTTHAHCEVLLYRLHALQRMIQERRAFLSDLFVYHRDVMRPIGQRALKARAARNSHIKAFHRRCSQGPVSVATSVDQSFRLNCMMCNCCEHA